jgi:hypothetical protein
LLIRVLQDSSFERNPVNVPLHRHASIGVDKRVGTRSEDSLPIHIDLSDHLESLGVFG